MCVQGQVLHPDADGGHHLLPTCYRKCCGLMDDYIRAWTGQILSWNHCDVSKPQKVCGSFDGCVAQLDLPGSELHMCHACRGSAHTEPRHHTTRSTRGNLSAVSVCWLVAKHCYATLNNCSHNSSCCCLCRQVSVMLL